MADGSDRVIRMVVEPNQVADRNILRRSDDLQVFYHRDLGTFWSLRSDLSDLAGPYLAAAHECVKAKGPIA